MRLPIACLAILAGFAAASCTEDRPPDRDSRVARSLGGGGGGGAVTSASGSRYTVEKAPVPPAGAEWTILCDSVSGRTHVEQAGALKNELIRTTGRNEFYVVHHDDDSAIYFGFYTNYREGKAQADLRQMATLMNRSGEPLFRHPILVPLDSPDPDAPPEWNLVNAPRTAFWSIEVGFYSDSADRKKMAVEAVREARKMGVPAYYYHGETASSVCIGLWPEDAVRKQLIGRTDDPSQPMMVLSGSSMPDNLSTEMRDASGQKVKLMGPKLEIVDPSLQEAIRQYPDHAVNGVIHATKKMGDKVIYDASRLVVIPHPGGNASLLTDGRDGGERQAQDLLRQPLDPTLPPTLQGRPGGAPGSPAAESPESPDPTLGALRSVGDRK